MCVVAVTNATRRGQQQQSTLLSTSTAAGAIFEFVSRPPMHGHTDTRTCVCVCSFVRSFVLAENWALPTPTRFPDSRVQIRSPPLGAIGIFFIKGGIRDSGRVFKIYKR